MTENVHQQAERLILASRIEDLKGADRLWLEEHLSACKLCAHRARSADEALRALRAVSVQVDSQLLSATRLRVYLRARELHHEHERQWALWISCALSWVLGVASAPFVWRAFAWFGARMSFPTLIWQLAFVLWWLVPTIVVVVILAAQRRHGGEHNNDTAVTLP